MPHSIGIVTRMLSAVCLAAAAGAAPAHAGDDAAGHHGAPFEREKACTSFTPAAIGGPVLAKRFRDVIQLRYLGTSNYELVYRGKVYLLDAYYKRGPRMSPLGFTVDQVKKATAIFIGHAHGDHVSDAPQVARQTGAPVVGSQVTADFLRSQGVADQQIWTVADGDSLQFDGLRVDVVLARHSVFTPQFLSIIAAVSNLYAAEQPPLTPEEVAERATIRGSSSPNLTDFGTLTYVFNFDNGAKLVFKDGPGDVTASETAYAAQLRRPVDVAILGYLGRPGNSDAQIAMTMPHLQLFKPRIMLPSHHDAIFPIAVDSAMRPLADRLHAVLPNTRLIDPRYREPLCMDLGRDGHRR